ncbi:MAG TPA: EAL domain-containing protein [Burkholderiales bacterium]|jgi:diguanylate cyclase (GGDEF)-like protein/PAS domain S-box-containing protein
MAKTCARERDSGSEGLFGEFAANVPEIVWMREVGSERILYVSPAWQEVTGCPPPKNREEFLSVVHPEDTARVKRDADAAPRGGVDHRYRIVRCDGTLRWLHTRTFAVRNAAGEVYRIGGIAQDVTEEMLKDVELRQFRAAVDASAVLVTLIDPARMRYVDMNDAACRALGYSREELLTMGPVDVFSEPGVDLAQAYERLLSGDQAAASVEGVYRRKDRSTFPVESVRRVVPSATGDIIVAIARDITMRKRAEEGARSHKLQQLVIAEFAQQALGNADLEQVMANAAEIVGLTLDVEHCKILQRGADGASLEVRAAFGCPAEVIGRQRPLPGEASQTVRVLAERRGVIVDDYAEAPCTVATQDCQCRLRSGAEVPIPGQKDGPLGVLGAYSRRERRFTVDELSFLQSIANNIAVAIERKSAEERFAYLAQFDALTGLPNRHLFQDRLAQTVGQAARGGSAMAVLFIDLDRFKLVNDAQGRDAGDRLLREAARRLSESVRGGDTVGRFGGDEFGVVLANLGRPGDASLVAQKIIDALARPVELDGHETYITASIGISVYPADGSEPEALLANADAAMYRAKEQGRNHYEYFTREMNERALRWVRMQTETRRALERGEFQVHYQPKVELATGKICGFEALLRWQHPDKGLVPPSEFIPVLEETGLIVPAGEWVMRTACAQIKAWREAGLPSAPIAVNLSARQFQQKDLEDSICRVLRESAVAPPLLQFELTESLLMGDPEAAARTLLGLKELGVRVSVDDFGTGYSSLAYLKRFAVNELKIDRVFIRDIVADPDDAAITLAIINLAHSLDLEVVAEGVETEAQVNFLRSHGCDQMQGYYFAAPCSADQCTQALRDDRRLRPPSAKDRDNAPSVLLVGGNEHELVLLGRALGPAGYRMLAANSEEAAFDALSKRAFDIVVCDQRLAGMSGADFLAAVRKLHPEVIRVLISAKLDTGALAEAVNAARIHKFISKDWDAKRLRSEVRAAYLRRHRGG